MPITLNGSSGITHPDNTVQRGYLGASSLITLNAASHDVTGIPNWARRVTVALQGASTNGTSNIVLRAGSGSIVAAGYLGANVVPIQGGATTGIGWSTGAEIAAQAGAADIWHGSIVLHHLGGNVWAINGALGLSNSVRVALLGGSTPALGGALDRIRLTTINGTDVFDAGTAIVLWE